MGNKRNSKFRISERRWTDKSIENCQEYGFFLLQEYNVNFYESKGLFKMRL